MARHATHKRTLEGKRITITRRQERAHKYRVRELSPELMAGASQ